jgi:hypothetical protein
MFFFLLGAKENDSPLKGVNRYLHFWVILDDFPSGFHVFAPVNVVENPNSFVGYRW